MSDGSLLATRGYTDLESSASQRGGTSTSDVNSLRNAIQVKKDIVTAAVLLKTARASSRDALPHSIEETRACADRSQALVDAVYARYLEVGESIKSQLKVMRASGTHHNIAGYFDSSSGATSVNATNRTSQHLIIVPEHFSRKDHWQKLLTCSKCCESNMDRHCKMPHNTKKSTALSHCKCNSSQAGKNPIINLPTSPWEGSQYKLTLVISLRAKVLLKYIFTAFVQNVVVQKYRRESVVTCCKNKLDLLLKRCFHSILFEALSNRYIAICADQTAFKLMKKKYLRPAFEGYSRLLTLRILSSKCYKTADKHRLLSQKRLALTALRNNKNVRKLFALKSTWASSHAPTMIMSHAFIGWMLALVRKNTVKAMLAKRFSSLDESESRGENALQGLSDIKMMRRSEGHPQGREGREGIERREGIEGRGLNESRVGSRGGSRGGTRDQSGLSDSGWADELQWAMNDDADDLEAFQVLKAEAMMSMHECQLRSYQSLSTSITKRFPHLKSSMRNLDPSSMNESGYGVNRLASGDPAQSFRSPRSTGNSPRFVSFRDTGGSRTDDSRLEGSLGGSRSGGLGGSMLGEGMLKSFRDSLSAKNQSERSEGQYAVRRSDGTFIGVSIETLQDTSTSFSPPFSPSFSPSKSIRKSLLERAMELSSPVGPRSDPRNNRSVSRSGGNRSRGGDSRLDPRSSYDDDEGAVSTDEGTCVTIQDEVLLATRLIRRCLRYFNKLRSVRRVSMAYRRVKRNHRECGARRLLSIWSKGAEGKRTVENICHTIAVRNAKKRGLALWVLGSLSRWRDLELKTRNLIHTNRMKIKLLNWNIFHHEKMKTRIKDEFLASSVRAVLTNNIRIRKSHYFDIWVREFGLLQRERKVKNRVKFCCFKKYFKYFLKKVKNRSLLNRVFTLKDCLLTQRLQRVSTTFRLLSSFISAWRDLTTEILSIKHEIIALQHEKMMRIERIEEELSQARLEVENMEIAGAFRGATLKAEVFCMWAEMALRRKNQRSAVISFSALRTRNTLHSFFQTWNNTNTTIKKIEDNIVQKVEELSRNRKEFSILDTWKKAYENRFEFPYNYYDKRLLRISFRNWSLMRTMRLFRDKLGPVCGANKVYMQRGLSVWVSAWRKKNKISYAVHLLQCTFDRVRARAALMRWPGWREWRRSEEMKSKMLLKKSGRGRLLGVVGLIEKEREDKNNGNRRQSDITNSLSFIRQIKDRLSLAERVAIEATYVLAEDSYDTLGNRTYVPSGVDSLSLPDSYKTAYAAAREMLLRRTGAYMACVAGEANGNKENRENKENKGRIENKENEGRIENKENNGNKDRVQNYRGGRPSSLSRIKDSNLDFFMESLRVHSSREEQAVKELLLLCQIVLLAWRKAVRMLRAFRGKERAIRRIADKGCIVRALRHWVTWTSSTSHRTLWILPDPNALPYLPSSKPSAADFYAAQRAGKFKKK